MFVMQRPSTMFETLKFSSFITLDKKEIYQNIVGKNTISIGDKSAIIYTHVILS